MALVGGGKSSCQHSQRGRRDQIPAGGAARAGAASQAVESLEEGTVTKTVELDGCCAGSTGAPEKVIKE